MPKLAKKHSPKRHTARRNEQARKRQQKRALPTNSKEWLALRRHVLDKEPLCRAGQQAKPKVTIAASEVDHIDGDATNNDLTNLQPLCKACHSVKTRAEQNGVTAKPGLSHS